MCNKIHEELATFQMHQENPLSRLQHRIPLTVEGYYGGTPWDGGSGQGAEYLSEASFRELPSGFSVQP